MTGEATICEVVEYQVVLVQPDSRRILAFNEHGRYRLPRVCIRQGTRRAEELRKTVHGAWGLHILVLEIVIDDGTSSYCVVAELLLPNRSAELQSISFNMVAESELTESQRAQVASVLSNATDNFFSTIGWIDQALLWLDAESGIKIASKGEIVQYSAGGGATLVCFRAENERSYWLKATSERNCHERAITILLSELGGAHLPTVIASRLEWNAWLMSGEATAIEDFPRDPFQLFRLLGGAIESMAELQLSTEGRGADLLRAGAFDQSLDALEGRALELFAYIEEAMAVQTSTKVPRLGEVRIQELRLLFEAACRRMKALDLPETIVHGDLNGGNILAGDKHCLFIDWCEAYVGNPLITLQHLLLFNRVENPELQVFVEILLKERYKEIWRPRCDPAALEEGFLYMPMVAALSSLYGRGDWLETPQRNSPHRQRYARTLGRHMEQAARAPALLHALST